MIKLDAVYLFELGSRLRSLAVIPEAETGLAQMALHVSEPLQALIEFMTQSIFREELHPLSKPADDLFQALKEYEGDIFELFDRPEKVGEWRIRSLKEKYRSFESVLLATLRTSQMYYVSPKGGYNTLYLTENGHLIFPRSLKDKVPQAIPDINHATRCIAFELPTAAGFHLHRANEAVLRVYWDNVTGGLERPKNGNMGDYLRELSRLGKGRESVRNHLKSIKDFHRNPLMHPEQSLDTIDEAITLLASIRSSIGYMLEEITVEPIAALEAENPS